MRIISMHKVDAAMEAGKMPGPEPIQGMGRLIGEMNAAGVFIDGAGLRPSATRVRLQFAGGERRIQKGPYAGSNELVRAFLQLKVRTLDEAIEWATRYGKAVGDVELELGPVTEPWDLGVMAKPDDAPLQCLLLHKGDAAFEAGKPLDAKTAEAVANVRAEMKTAGVLTATKRLKPSKQGRRIEVADKRVTVVDGPFAESKELIAGFVIWELPSLDAADPWCRKFADVIGNVHMELRAVEPDDET